MNMSYCKYGYSNLESTSYHSYETSSSHVSRPDFIERPWEYPIPMNVDAGVSSAVIYEENVVPSDAGTEDGILSHQEDSNHQDILEEDDIDPDSMTYEQKRADSAWCTDFRASKTGGHMSKECQLSGNNEPIPALLEGLIDHLIQWHLISESRRPNSCIINYFDEGEYSQPFLKPPHLEQPVSTLVLAESMMAFGRTLVSDSEGNYKGSLMLSLKQGSLLVMRGNSADMARHAMCSSPNKRVTITFFKVRTQMGNEVCE